MDVVRLGPRYSTDYFPDKLIEGYSTCIWAERFGTMGDFKIITPNIVQTLELLPEDTLISHLETDEVMMVESHEIIFDDDDIPMLEVSGRSITSIFGDRYVEAMYQKRRKMRLKYSATSAAAVLIWQAINNATGKDVTRGDRDGDTPEVNDYNWPSGVLDQIPNAVVTDSVNVDGTARNWWLQEGVLQPQLESVLLAGRMGLRTIRPTESGTSGQVVTVDAALATRGTPIRTQQNNITALRFDLYDGIDRSHDQEVNPKVGFSTLKGDLDNARYLWSKKDYKTVVEVITSINVADRYRPGTNALTGLQRRVTQLDAGAPEIPTEPKRPKDPRKNASRAEIAAWRDAIDAWRVKHDRWENKRDAIVAEFKADVLEDADAELTRTRRLVMLSGDISPNSPYVYRKDYNLGDTVSLHGDYGMVEDMVVAEHIRTEDAEGDRGIPGLVLP